MQYHLSFCFAYLPTVLMVHIKLVFCMNYCYVLVRDKKIGINTYVRKQVIVSKMDRAIRNITCMRVNVCFTFYIKEIIFP